MLEIVSAVILGIGSVIVSCFVTVYAESGHNHKKHDTHLPTVDVDAIIGQVTRAVNPSKREEELFKQHYTHEPPPYEGEHTAEIHITPSKKNNSTH